MNLDEMLQDAIASINGMSDKEFEQELVEAGFQLAPVHMQDGETQVPDIEDKVTYSTSKTPYLDISQTYNFFNAPSNDSCYNAEQMVS